MRVVNLLVGMMMVGFLLSGCQQVGKRPTLTIISGSENKLLEPVVAEYGREHGVDIQMVYKGSVDIMLELKDGSTGFDAVWPANSLWIELSGNRNVRHEKSIFQSPVVLGVKRSRAEALGLLDRANVSLADLVELSRAGKLPFIMSNPTQSNSGAMGYLGFLHGVTGKDTPFTADDLNRQETEVALKALLGAIARTSGSSGWLKDLYLENVAEYDAMINYEALIIEANLLLEARGDEPLICLYLAEGQPIADSPLGFVKHADDADNANKEALFLEFQSFLLSPDVQQRLAKLGRRTGVFGHGSLDADVFRKEWGIDPERVLQPVPLPGGEVIQQALRLYQTRFKKPSLTAFVLDYSGSMKDEGEKELEAAMTVLLDPEQAERFMLLTGERDMTYVIPFDSEPRDVIFLEGNDPKGIRKLQSLVLEQRAEGGTNIYLAAETAMKRILATPGREQYQVSIILMTDGKSSGSFNDFQQAWQSNGAKIPVFSITFGNADEEQLKTIANTTNARVFSGQSDLRKAFRKAKGYN